eukprot:1522097-Prymnesium_polylepis.1
MRRSRTRAVDEEPSSTTTGALAASVEARSRSTTRFEPKPWSSTDPPEASAPSHSEYCER